MEPIEGLHHITAVASDPQANVDFYQRILGQRLIKTTVNFDDPGTYHLYYADASGTPGSMLTFFPWQGIKRGQLGNGEAAAVAYAIPKEAFDFWQDWLARHHIDYTVEPRFGVEQIIFRDPDGLTLELVPLESPPDVLSWKEGPIPEKYVIHGFAGVTLWLTEVEATVKLLTSQLGYTEVGREGRRFRLHSTGTGLGMIVDLLHRPGAPWGQLGSGSVHHIAFRANDDAEQGEYRQKLLDSGQHVTPVRDRQYFHSIYFREPGGVLFEIATNGPGFLIDESQGELGHTLRLPPWLEDRRGEIERHLPPISRSIELVREENAQYSA
jgi:glyoxalase family protein